MRYLILIVLGVWWMVAHMAEARAAEERVTFDLHGVVVGDLCRVLLDDVARASVVLDSEVLRDHEQVSFALKRVTVASAIRELEAVLKSRGFELVKSDGVYRVRKRLPEDDEVLVYEPRFRSVGYLADLVGGLLGQGAVTTQRGVRDPGQGEFQDMRVDAKGQGAPSSALGLIDRSDKDVLVLKARADKLVQAKRVLSQVDKPIPELLVKAVVMEVQTGRTEGSAVNLVAQLLAKGLPGVSISIQGGADQKNGVSLKVDRLEALWSAISSDTRFKVISAPQVRVKSGGQARFSVGAEVPILGAIQFQGNGQSQQSVIYKPSGVILELRPEIRGELTELKIQQQLSSFAKTETGVNNSPTLMKRELSTSVVVGGNDVVLLGGLDEDRSQGDDSGLFFLPAWLRSHGEQSSRSEIVLMLHVERVRSDAI